MSPPLASHPNRQMGPAYFLELSFAPRCHSLVSPTSFLASSAAAFWAAASALRALPATFLLLSPPPFLPAMVRSLVGKGGVTVAAVDRSLVSKCRMSGRCAWPPGAEASGAGGNGGPGRVPEMTQNYKVQEFLSD